MKDMWTVEHVRGRGFGLALLAAAAGLVWCWSLAAAASRCEQKKAIMSKLILVPETIQGQLLDICFSIRLSLFSYFIALFLLCYYLIVPKLNNKNLHDIDIPTE